MAFNVLIGLRRRAGVAGHECDFASDRRRLAKIFRKAILTDHGAHGGVSEIVCFRAAGEHADTSRAAGFRQQTRPGPEILPIAAAKLGRSDPDQMDLAKLRCAGYEACGQSRLTGERAPCDCPRNILTRRGADDCRHIFRQRRIAHSDDEGVVRRWSLDEGDAALRHGGGR